MNAKRHPTRHAPTRSLILGALLLAASLSPAITPTTARANTPDAAPAPAFPWQDEELRFRIQVNGADAVHASLRSGKLRVVEKHGYYIPISASARSVGLFDALYPVDDRANTFINPASLRPYRSEKVFREGGKTRSYRVDYVHDTRKARVHKKAKVRGKRRIYDFFMAIPSTTHDALSWYYELRAADLAVGKKLTFFLYDGWKLSRLELDVTGTQDVYTPAGWFKTWKIEVHRELLYTRITRLNKKGQVKGTPRRAIKGARYHVTRASQRGARVARYAHQHPARYQARRARALARKNEPNMRVRKKRHHIGTIWLSKDRRRLPVKVDVDLTASTRKNSLIARYGRGQMILTHYRAGRPASTQARRATTGPTTARNEPQTRPARGDNPG